MGPRHPLQPKNWSMSRQTERVEALRPHLSNKSVLDLGAGSGWWRDDWMFDEIRGMATEAVGVELSAEHVASVKERWQVDLLEGDAATVRTGRSFDVVHAGELIEHLSSFVGLLETAKAHLEPGGRFVISTPNAFAISNFIYRVGSRPRVNAEHTCWFCEDTITTLLNRHGFMVSEIQYPRHFTPGLVRRLVVGGIRSMLSDRLSGNTLLVVAELDPAAVPE